MPFLCCGGSTEENVVTEDGAGRGVPGDASPPVIAEGDEEKEKAIAESIYHDARQSLTMSMVYRPLNVSLMRSNFSLDTKPQELLMKNNAAAKQGVTDSVVVRQGLEQQPASSGFQANPGYPGSLTDKELEACLEFRKFIRDKRPEEPTYYEIVHCYDDFEDEAFSLCRIMRARNFVVQDAVTLLGGSIETWGEARAHNFYPDLQQAMGCPASIVPTELPLIPSGIAKNGSMVAYFKAGSIDLKFLDCLTDLDNFISFIWNTFTHRFREIAVQAQKEFPNTTILGEVTIVIDLKGISRSLFTEKVMEVLKKAIKVLNCFPEALSKLIIFNAPFFFSAIWLVLKVFLDPRTIQKVDIFAYESSGMKCIAEHIDSTQLIADYGGKGPSCQDILHQLREKGTLREVVERFMINSRGNKSWDVELAANEKATVSVLTRSSGGVQFTIEKSGEKVGDVVVEPDGGGSGAYTKTIVSGVVGPGKLTVAAKSSSSHTEHFLVVVRVYPA